MDDLSKRSLIGLARFQIALGVLIFLPAWSLTYWRGWLYWFVFGVCGVAITLYFLRHEPMLVQRRMRAGPTAEKDPRQKVIMTFASVDLIALYLLSVLDWRFGWSSVPPLVSIAAAALVVFAYYGFYLVFRVNAFTAATVQVEAEQRVISTGPYAVVRHPMYAFALPMFLATPPALGSWWGLIPATLMIGLLAWRLLDEERQLVLNLAGYTDYQRKVTTRLIPGVW